MADNSNIAGLWLNYDVEADKIEELRKACYDYALSHPNEIEIEDVRNRIDSPEDVANNNARFPHNWMLKRFLIGGHRDVKQALQKFIAAFQFRKEYHLHTLKIEDVLPKEFYELMPLEDGGFDKEGNKVLILRLKFYRKIPQFDLLIRRAFVYIAEQRDLEYERGDCRGVVLFFDAQGFGVSQLDFDILKFAILSVPGHYAGLVRYMVVCDLSFLLTYVFKVIEGWMPQEKGSKNKYLFQTTRKQLDNLLPVEERPDFLNGKREIQKSVPANAKDCDALMNSIDELQPQNIAKINTYVRELMAQNK